VSKPKSASDILARFRKTTEQAKPIAVVVPEIGESDTPPPLSAEPTPAPEPPLNPTQTKVKPIRYTVDLDPEQHKFLKRFAVEAEVDGSVVVRELLRRLEQDKQLSIAVLQQLSK
jgi:hypothetical protein